MASWFIRLALLRFLGRRMVPFLLAYDFFRVLLAARRAMTKPRSTPDR